MAGAANGAPCDPEPFDMTLVVEVTTSGFSSWLLISDSTGIVCVGGVTGTGPVTFCPGVDIGCAVLGVMNGTGKFGCGMVWPAGSGRTN